MSLKTTAAGAATLAILVTLAFDSAQASTIEFTSLAAFTAATTSPSLTGFNGILGPGDSFLNFSPLTVNGVTFSTPNPDTFVKVTAGTTTLRTITPRPSSSTRSMPGPTTS